MWTHSQAPEVSPDELRSIAAEVRRQYRDAVVEVQETGQTLSNFSRLQGAGQRSPLGANIILVDGKPYMVTVADGPDLKVRRLSLLERFVSWVRRLMLLFRP